MKTNKSRQIILASVVLFALMLSASFASANTSTETTPASVVNSITLTQDDSKITWVTDGNSSMGFKVVWSKNTNPVYPNRDGDKYHYFTDPNQNNDTLEAFSGGGTYYVRVCEYLGGKCGKYSNEISVSLGDAGINNNIVCAEDYAPVCGLFNDAKKTYSNKCELGKAGALFKFNGTCEDGPLTEVATEVKSITAEVSGTKVKWTTDGTSAKGFKVVWSKNQAPTYPTREGDSYKYLTDPSSYYAVLEPFSGTGIYYARVCEYLGGACGVYSNEVKLELVKAESKDKEIAKIEEKSKMLSDNRLDDILKELKELRNQVKEQQSELKYLRSLVKDMNEITGAMQSSIKNFVAYGVDNNTKKLGEGERAAVIYSFKNAYNKLPENESEMADAIKIANGRFPTMKSEEAEAEAKAKFQEIYQRDPNMNDPEDKAAIAIMAYGIRQKASNRNLNSEKSALKIYKRIYGSMPKTTDEWNALQAITYSGASR